MYYTHRVPDRNRRLEPRVRLEMFLNQYVNEHPYRSLAINLSHTGIFMQKLAEPLVHRARMVGLEFELPGTGEVIWASAECRFDSIGEDFHTTGVRFVAMADKHLRLLRDFVSEKQRRAVQWARRTRSLIPN